MNQNELFKNYLEGKLSQEDQTIIERLLAENPTYRAEWEKFKEAHQPQKQSRAKSWASSFLIALGIVSLGIFLVYSLATPPGTKLFASYYEPLERVEWKNFQQNQEFAKSLTAYRGKNYEGALLILEKLDEGQDHPEVLFLFGLCHLAMDRPEKAVPILSRIPLESTLAGEAAWYEGLGYLKLNKLEEAKPLLEIASENSSQFSQSAKEILEKLK